MDIIIDIKNMNGIHGEIIQEMELITKLIIKQNYFELNFKFYQQSGLAMGAPSSALLSEIYLQHLEHNKAPDLLKTHKTNSYHRYVDYILIVYNRLNTDINNTLVEFNNIHRKIQFSIEEENNNQINLFRSVHIENSLQFGIFRKRTATDIMIHNTSCHPTEHKISGINNLINRILTYPISEPNINKEKQRTDTY
jgi:hypothetical protein